MVVSTITTQMAIGGVSEEVSLSLQAIANIKNLAAEIEKFLLRYQDQHIIAKDWRAIGFITTLLNFSNKLIIHQLTSAEKVLLCPYFKFVEEQVAIPYERVCAAAAKHQLGSKALTLVEQMFPMASEIASTVYCQLIQLFPHHRSKRGGLSNPDVAHSCLRDLDMFQAYLWLCVLEESLRPIERELVSLCVMVLPSVGVEWEMTDKWKRLLTDEIISRVQPEHKPLLLNYTQGMEQAFFDARKRLGHQGEMIEIPSNEENLTFHVNHKTVYSN